jgi:hypothetical protein
MLSSQSLLEMYRVQKSIEDEPCNHFPSFIVWKEQMLREREVDMNNADISNIPLSVNNNTIIKKSTNSNMDKARNIFIRLIDDSGGIIPSRKEVMTILMTELNISSACASTYSHNIRQKYL